MSLRSETARFTTADGQAAISASNSIRLEIKLTPKSLQSPNNAQLLLKDPSIKDTDTPQSLTNINHNLEKTTFFLLIGLHEDPAPPAQQELLKSEIKKLQTSMEILEAMESPMLSLPLILKTERTVSPSKEQAPTIP